jgi:hypothetical protein
MIHGSYWPHNEEGQMADRGVMSRLLPLTGIATVVLWVVGAFTAGEEPDWEDPASEMVAYINDDSGKILAGGLLFLAGCLFFLWFLNLARTRLGEIEARYSSLAFAAGTGTAIVLMLWRAPVLGLAIAVEDNDAIIEGGAAQFALLGATGFFVVAELLAGVLLLTVALIGLRTGALPKWYSWASIVVTVVLWVPPIGWAALLLGVPLWILLTGFMLQGRAAAPAPAP